MTATLTRRKLLPAAGLLLASAFVPAAAPEQEPVDPRELETEVDERSPVGMNLRPVGPRDREWVFADALALASAWQYVDEHGYRRRPGHGRGVQAGEELEEEERVPVDAQGWPLPAEGRAIACALFFDMRDAYPAGEYVCTWKGSGRVELAGAARVAERGDHRLVAAVDPGRGEVVVRVEGIERQNPLGELHLWFPGLEGSRSPFHPLFLERLRPFSVIRFYPWMRPYTASGRWAGRATPEDARQSTGEGVAVEYMVALCNELGAEPWFTIPHTADDEYVRSFARLVRETLHSDARVWVELSNELWNPGFPAARWAQGEAQRRGVRAAQVVAEAAAHVFRIWREAFAAAPERVVRVAAGHLHNPGYARALCQGLEGELDALAVGAYFGVRPGKDGSGRGSSAEELLSTARTNLRELVLPRIAEHAQLARQLSLELGRHVALVAYEGGPSIVARGPNGETALDPAATYACQRSARMAELYGELLDGAARSGLELFVAYDFVGQNTPADTFGHLETLDQPEASAPKYRALIARASRRETR